MTRLRSNVRGMCRDQHGSVLVELAMVLPLIFLLIFAIFDYGRLFWLISSSRKATEMAVRTAVVRPPICPGVPDRHTSGGSGDRFGTLCRAPANSGGTVCASIAPIRCTLDDAAPSTSDPDQATRHAVSQEIWSRISALLPPTATADNIQITYASHPELGFLGGPFTPEITVEIVDLDFEFVMPIGPLADVAAGGSETHSTGWSRIITFPGLSTSLPAEDLAHGAGEI